MADETDEKAKALKADETDEKIEALKAKRDELLNRLNRRIKRLEARANGEQKRVRTRALVLLGVVLEKECKQSADARDVVLELISKHLEEREKEVVRSFLSQRPVRVVEKD